MISGTRGQFVLTDGSDEEHSSKGVYDTYTKTNLRYSQVRSTMHVVCITQHIHTYTDIPRWYRWTCSKKETPKQISLYKLICTLPPVHSTTSSSLQRVCYCIDIFMYVCTLLTLLSVCMYMHVFVNVCKVVHKDMKCMENIMLMHKKV